MELNPTERLGRPEFFRREPTSGALHRRRFWLSVLTGPQAGRKLELGGTLFVGSHPDCGLCLDDSAASRHHLELEVGPDGIRLKDLKSTNGTLLGGARVDEAFVAHESQVTVGRTDLLLSVEDEDLGEAVSSGTQFGQALGATLPMRRLFGMLERVAPLDATVLLLGETGTGKEVLAEALHQGSPRFKKGNLVVVDCGSVAPTLIESELFGHVRGAFTGAVTERLGAFLEADGGTLFLDEIGELPLELQPKLLRVLQTGTLKRVGEDKPRNVDVRVVAATHRDLEAEVNAGRFRKDLYYRLAVVIAQVPSLRERREDIPLLCEHFLRQLGGQASALSDSLRARLMAHPWPGNVRELRNVVQRALAGIGGDPLGTAAGGGGPIPGGVSASELPFKEAKDQIVEAFTREYLTALLSSHKGNISAVARSAGLNRNYVRELVTRYGLKGSDTP